MDPLYSLPAEIFSYILSYLTPPELGKCALMSTMWNEVANSTYVWDTMCDRLWRDKVYVPEEFRQEKSNGNPKRAYFKSIDDASRKYIKDEELCSFMWNFRFKEAAGDHWLNNDPWWKDSKPARVRFFPDGTSSTLDDWPAPQHDENTGQLVERRWKFINAAAGKQGPRGSFLQINTFPPLIVSRFSNWGFLLQSCWVFYTSFPMPPRGVCTELEDSALDVTTETMKQEAMRYNIGVEFNLHDHAQILDLLQLLAHIHQPNGNFEINFPDDEDEGEDAHDEDDGDEDDDATMGDDDEEDEGDDGDGDHEMDAPGNDTDTQE
eukprot:Phypoly_transcript_12205.p1 GENE.Phypoly_transcript_12205~~Phypoly_transcript_12205.p1  ORF type:complete len:367 (+),score=70.76 Phypoly_transcript_12205:140-1102(+)